MTTATTHPAPDLGALESELADLDTRIAETAAALEKAEQDRAAALARGDGQALARVIATTTSTTDALALLRGRRKLLEGRAAPLRAERDAAALEGRYRAIRADIGQTLDALAEELAPALRRFDARARAEAERLRAAVTDLQSTPAPNWHEHMYQVRQLSDLVNALRRIGDDRARQLAADEQPAGQKEAA